MLVKNNIEKHPVRDLKVRANARKTFPTEEELKALGRSYMKRPIHPLVILRDLTLIDGECRTRGIMLIDPNHPVDCIYVEKELAPAEITELQMISAMHSTSLKIDRDPSTVSVLNALWKCIPAAIEAAEQGHIGPKAWHQISLLPPSDQGGLLEMYLSKMPAAQIADISRKLRKPASAGSTVKVGRIKCEVPGRGATV